MAMAKCTDCGHRWDTAQPATELRERPECAECGSGAIDVKSSDGWYVVWR